MRIFLAVISFLLIFSANAESREKIMVDIAVVPPMVIKQDSGYSGFDIELMQAIAQELDVSVEYREVPFAQIFEGIKNKERDAALGGITITEERERFADFSHHYFDSGLHILVPVEHVSTFFLLFRSFIDSDMHKWFLYLFGIIFIAGNIFWYCERGKNLVANTYIPGLFDGCWCIIVTMATVGYGDIFPKSWQGRVVAGFIMMFGIGFFTIATSNLSSSMTVTRLKRTISSPEDLVGKRVATLAGSTSVSYLQGIRARVAEVKNIEEAFKMLIEKDISAVVYDVPVLLYYEQGEGRGISAIAGQLFEKQYYGIAFPELSALREPVNRTLLKLRQNGFYDNLYKKWFGVAGK